MLDPAEEVVVRASDFDTKTNTRMADEDDLVIFRGMACAGSPALPCGCCSTCGCVCPEKVLALFGNPGDTTSC